LGEKTSQATLFCLAFDGFILSAADLVHNSTVSSQIVYLRCSRQARQLVLCRIYVKNGEETRRRSPAWETWDFRKLVLPTCS